MKLLLDEYAYLNSCIHSWQSKPKFIALVSLIFAFAFIQKLALLPLIILLTSVLYYLSKLPIKFLLSRLRYPGIFILAVVILLPFLAGKTVIFNWGFLQLKQEGCLLVFLIVTRFVCILTTSLVLFGTAPFFTTLKTLRQLGLSPIISDMMLLTYRYLEELGDRLITMQRALQLKGFHPHNLSRRNLKIIASLMGSLLVRSYDDSKLVYQAMILRGYGHQPLTQKNYRTPIAYSDWLACGFVFLISSSLIIAQTFLL
jgi:cobalt/nickel transport system permease protein